MIPNHSQGGNKPAPLPCYVTGTKPDRVGARACPRPLVNALQHLDAHIALSKQVQTAPKHGTMRAMNELTNQIERLQGRVHETMVRL